MASNDDPDTGNKPDFIEIDPLPVDTVVRQAVLLLALVRRAVLEEPGEGGEETDADARETDRFELWSWMRNECASVMGATGREILQTPVGELSEEQVTACMEAAIAANAVGWALGLIDALDPADANDLDIIPLMEWMPQSWTDLDKVAAKSSLRDDETLAREQERWEIWTTRAGFLRDPEAFGNEWRDLADLVHESGDPEYEALVESDFEILGTPLLDMTDDQLDLVIAVAGAYLVTLDRLCGYDEMYDEGDQGSTWN